MNAMNAGMELDIDEEMISVSPIYKTTPVNNKPNRLINDGSSEGANSPPSVFGSSPPSMIRQPPTLKHQHSYAGHEEEMNEDTHTVGLVPRAPSGRSFLSTRHLSIEDYSNDNDNDNDHDNSNSNEETSPPRNNSSLQWTNHPAIRQHQQSQQRLAEGDSGENTLHQQQREHPSVALSSSAPEEQSQEETAEERARREEEESIALAQMLMAEEAVASHRMSADFLRMNADQFSAEDFAALQDALREEEEAEYDESGLEGEEGEEDLSYDALLRLGDALGDVKTDRWTRIAHKEIAKLETFQYDPSIHKKNDDEDTKMVDIDDSELKCLVCQFTYEKGDHLRRLPCGHCFHKDCIDQWLQTKDCCAYCRQSILPNDGDKKEEAQN